MDKSNKSEKKISLVETVSKIKLLALAKGDKAKSHVIFGVDIDENGKPQGILASVEATGFVGLGMLDAIQIMIDEWREKLSGGFVNVIEQGVESGMGNAGIMFGGDPESDAMINDIVRKYKERLMKALIEKDTATLSKIKEEIIEEIKKAKGPDFDAEIIFGKSNKSGGIDFDKDDLDEKDDLDLRDIF